MQPADPRPKSAPQGRSQSQNLAGVAGAECEW